MEQGGTGEMTDIGPWDSLKNQNYVHTEMLSFDKRQRNWMGRAVSSTNGAGATGLPSKAN